MDLDVVGRHAILFDDDTAAAFVNSTDALVEWNSLLIDRYDVRHLLSSPPPPRKRRNPQQTHSPSSASSIESELDHERYLDLPPPSEEQDEGTEQYNAGGYRAVAFSYGNAVNSTDQKDSDAGPEVSAFHPPFPVPESLLQSLPSTEKLHQIIARTAMFVRKHGGQSEIVLRVKQGDNPTFGFLMPDHQLHAYFRFLVEHQELLQSDTDVKSEAEKEDDTKSNETDGCRGGALSLLGSVYGSGEDEDGAMEDAPKTKETVVEKASDASSAPTCDGSKETEHSGNVDEKDETVAKHPSLPKQKAQVLKKNSFTGARKAGTTENTKIEGDSVGFHYVAKSQTSAPPNVSKVEQLIVEPPSDLKRLVDRIVEFIVRNGKQFEAVLLEQDSKHGRFPFLLPSNQYHPYYVKVLQKAQEPKLAGKSFLSEKDNSMLSRQDRKTSLYKDRDSSPLGSAGCDIPYDADKKEKFRMVIGKSKKDGLDPPSKATQPQFGVSVDAAAAAAILQAATRGIKKPNLGILSSTSLNGDSQGRNSEVGQASSFGSHHSSHPDNVIQKSERRGDQSLPVPVAKAIAKTAAIEAANEADSSEAHLTKEQKLKAERLKRARMFVAMLKSGAAPLKSEPSRSLSVEPQESGVAASGDGVVNLVSKEREGSCIPFDVSTADKKQISEKKYSDDEYHERMSRRKYRSRSSKHEDEEEEEVDDEDEEEEEEERNERHSKKKCRSHRPAQTEGEEEDREGRHRGHARRKHRSHHSSREGNGEEDDEDERDHRHSRKKHRSHRSSRDGDGYEEEKKHSRKKHRSHHSSRHSRDRHKHKERDSSSEHTESRHRHKHESSSDEEHHHHSDSKRRRKISRSEDELEEGEISSKISDRWRGSGGAGVSREASLDLSSSYRDGRAPSQPSVAMEVSDDLRAKIRAMLKATL